MNKCIVIGGGFAGLTTAVYLANKNLKVDLLESSPKLGGRTYSFLAKDGITVVDNGQHILMGCYYETLRFMKMIGAHNNLNYQSALEINFLKENFQLIKLNTKSLPYPFNLLSGILKYKAVVFSDRLKIIKFFLKVFTYSDEELNRLTVEEWLKKENQNNEINKALWEILSIGALNTSIRKASAKVFSLILKEIFLKGKSASGIILPEYGLSETYCENSVRYLEEKGCRIFLSSAVKELVVQQNRIVEVKTENDTITDFECVISAIPFYALQKIITLSYINKKPELRYSSIVSIHVWLSANPLKERFYGLINSPLHWIFNNNTHITLVISDADYLIEKSKEEIIELASNELQKFTNIPADDILDYQVIKEKRATFVPAENILNSRPSVVTALDNFFVAGDWIDTGLPSTIESAVKSGRMAAESVLQSKSCKFSFYNDRKKNNVRKS